MVLQNLLVSQNFSRISRVSSLVFAAVICVSQFRFFKKENPYLLLLQSPIYLSASLKTTRNPSKLRLNRTKLFYIPLDPLELGRHLIFAPRKTHNAISSRRCMRIRGKLELRLQFPITLIVIGWQNGDNFGERKSYHFPAEKRARCSPRRTG